MVLYLPGELTMKKIMVQWKERPPAIERSVCVLKMGPDLFSIAIDGAKELICSESDLIHIYECLIKAHQEGVF